MRRNAATAALGSLACLLFCCTPMLAKPTRSISHAGASRWATTPPSLRSSRARFAKKPAAEHRVVHADAHPGSARTAVQEPRSVGSAQSRVPARTSAHLRGSKRARTLASQAEIAARSAILAADEARNRRASFAAVAQSPAIENPVAPAAVADNAAAGNDPVASGSAVLVNDGGTLRSFAAGQRLKSVEEEAATPVLLPPLRVASLYDSSGRLIVPPPLYGSHEVLLHQNEMADRDGLTRVRDDADLLDLRREKKLVALPESEALTVDYHLPENRRFSLPWTAAFLAVLARDYYASFHSPLQVDSAVRTIAVQQRLVRTNGNAAPTSGDTASPHLTGQAVDIAKGGLNRTEIAWLRTYLQPLIDQGKIDVEEEFQQACFHISVYKNYLPATSSRIAIAARQAVPESLPERPTE